MAEPKHYWTCSKGCGARGLDELARGHSGREGGPRVELSGSAMTVLYTLHGDGRAITAVARGDNGVWGYARAVPRRYPYGKAPTDRFYAEIVELWVGEAHRRQGIGTNLIQQLVEWAHANDYTHLNAEVSAANEGSNEFWKQQSFWPRSVTYDLEVLP